LRENFAKYRVIFVFVFVVDADMSIKSHISYRSLEFHLGSEMLTFAGYPASDIDVRDPDRTDICTPDCCARVRV
jgi:hypothetical protein